MDIIESEIEKLEDAKQVFAEVLSAMLRKNGLLMVQYLQYKKDVMQCSSMERLNLMAKNLMEEVFG